MEVETMALDGGPVVLRDVAIATIVAFYNVGAHWCHLAFTTEPSMGGGDAASYIWSPYGIGQTIIFSSCGFSLSSIFFFFPRLISAAAHLMSTILPHKMVWP